MSARKTMEVTSYVSLNRWILKFIGLYPTSFTRIFTVAFFMILLAVPQLLLIYHSTDLDVLFETSSVLLTIILALLKIIVWITRRDEIHDLITYMFDDYWKITKSGGRTPTCFLKYATFAKKLTFWYAFVLLNTLIVFYSIPLVQLLISKITGSVNESQKLLNPGMYPKGWTTFPFHQLVLLSQGLATSSCAAVLLAIDSLVATAILHTCGHFKMIQENLRSLGDNMNDHFPEMSSLVRHQSSGKSLKIIVKEKLADCIKHHQVVLKFAETMERLFSPIMFCQVLASNVIICLVGLQVSSPSSDQSKALKYCSYLLLVLYQLLLFCFPGDELINESLAVSNAVYASNWHNISELVKNDVIFIIAKSQRPVRITACKFSVMCLEHLAAVLSTSLSYFTVLRNLS